MGRGRAVSGDVPMSGAWGGGSGARTILGAAALGMLLLPAPTPAQVRIMSKGVPAPANGPSKIQGARRSQVSQDGTLVVSASFAQNLVPGQIDPSVQSDVFLYDRVTDQVTLVSHQESAPLTAGNGSSDLPVISPDGAYVVFVSTADDLVTGATGYVAGKKNVFLWEAASNTTFLVSHDVVDPLKAGDNDSLNPVINRSPGLNRFVAFESLATNLITGDTNSFRDVFRFELASGIIALASEPNDFSLADGDSFNASINGPGSCVAFESDARNLFSGNPANDGNSARDVLRWAAVPVDHTILLSHRAGTPSFGPLARSAGGGSAFVSIDDICEFSAFASTATDLVAGQVDSNGGFDVFLSNNGVETFLVSRRHDNPVVEADKPSGAPLVSHDGAWVAFDSQAIDLVNGQVDSASSLDVFLFDVTRRAVPDANRLVSHEAGDQKKAGNGSSFESDISDDGSYVAYQSNATNLDSNQKDTNGVLDAFLYNRLWDLSVVATRRKASISITGNGAAPDAPSISGQGLAVAFGSFGTDHVGTPEDTNGVQDAFLFTAPDEIPFFTVTSKSNENTLEWLTPPVDYAQTRIVRKNVTCPTSPTDGLILPLPAPPGPQNPAANGQGRFVDNPVTNGTTYCYAAFAERPPGPVPFSPGRTVKALPFNPVNDVKWAFNTAVASLAQPGIGQNAIYPVSQNGGVYAIQRGAAGGLWLGSFWPLATGGPISSRPGVAPVSVAGSSQTLFTASGDTVDAYAYAIDADRGALAGGALWQSPRLGENITAAAAAMFSFFGGTFDYVLVGSRNSAPPNSFFALDVGTGAVVGPRFEPGASLGMITGGASVDYARDRVYFTSQLGSSNVWCLPLTAGGLGGPCWAPQLFGVSDLTSPVLRGDRLYVGGGSTGVVQAFDADVTGSPLWAPPKILGSQVKGFVFPDRSGISQDLYASAGNSVHGFRDGGGSFVDKWPAVAISNPSTPLHATVLGTRYLYVGSGSGELCQIDADIGSPSTVCIPLPVPGGGPSVIGPPSFDVFSGMVCVGSDAGTIFGVEVPLICVSSCAAKPFGTRCSSTAPANCICFCDGAGNCVGGC